MRRTLMLQRQVKEESVIARSCTRRGNPVTDPWGRYKSLNCRRFLQILESDVLSPEIAASCFALLAMTPMRNDVETC